MLDKMFRCFIVALLAGSVALGQEAVMPQAATVAEAQAVLDLSGEPLVEASGEAQTGVAFQSFKVAGSASQVAKDVDAKLLQHGLKQLAGATFTDAYSSATYQKSGFTFNLMVMPTSEAKLVMVTLTNQGNIDLAKLPKPAGTKDLFVQPSSALYLSDLSVAQANQQCRQLLEMAGWEWFGDTTASFFMRQNAVRLQVMCSASPAQQGKTVIQLATEQLSSALPIIPGLVRIGYADITMRQDGDSKSSEEELMSAYRHALEAEGWKATTEQPIEIDFVKHLIFRNAAEELAELTFRPVDSLTRFGLEFKTAAQVEQENQQAVAMAAAAKLARDAAQEKMDNPPVISLDKPDTATLTTASKRSLEFSTRSGTAHTIVAKWLQGQKVKGWKVQAEIDTREIGEFELTKEEQKFNLSFVDPGFIPGEITISTSPKFQLQVNK